MKSSNLFDQCRQVYEKLDHVKNYGWHGQSRKGGNPDRREGPIHLGRHPRSKKQIMVLYAYPKNKAKNYFGLFIPGKRAEVLVYADPTAWGHKADQVTDAKPATVQAFLQDLRAEL